MAGSLRDQLAENFPEETQAPPEATPEAVIPSEPAGNEAAGATPAPIEKEPAKPGRTAGRPRDEYGRLLPGKPDKPDAEQTSAAEPRGPTPIAPTQAAQTPAAETPLKRPSTWKKETFGLWDKVEKGEPLTPAEARQFAEEAARRDGDYSRGVSTYKQEYDRAKPYLEVVNQNAQLFQQHGIDPAQQFAKYIEVHKGLALGTPQQKLGMFLRLAQDYQIPVQQLFTKGEDGQIYFNPQVQAPAQQQAAPDPRVAVRTILAEERATQQIEEAARDTEKYPHFEAVRATMGQLLDSGLASDLPSAYQTALALPQYAHLTEADRQQVQQREEAAKREALQAATRKAKANAVSTRSQTPTSAATTTPAKGLRGALEENANAIFAGRV